MITDCKVKNRYHGNMREKHNQVSRATADSGLTFMITPAKLSDSEIIELWISQGYDATAYRCSHEHDCCACVFYGNVMIRRIGSRAIATQGFGINI